MTARPKDPERVRSEPYRRLVAALPCILCGEWGSSQAAHPNSSGLILGFAGKAKALKADDRLCFPLGHEGACGHHRLWDTWHYGRELQRELEPKLILRTWSTLRKMAEGDMSVRRVLLKVGLLKEGVEV